MNRAQAHVCQIQYCKELCMVFPAGYNIRKKNEYPSIEGSDIDFSGQILYKVWDPTSKLILLYLYSTYTSKETGIDCNLNSIQNIN